jgi:hypothetical protein
MRLLQAQLMITQRLWKESRSSMRRQILPAKRSMVLCSFEILERQLALTLVKQLAGACCSRARRRLEA